MPLIAALLKCEKCGAEIRSDWRFCPHCSAEIVCVGKYEACAKRES